MCENPIVITGGTHTPSRLAPRIERSAFTFASRTAFAALWLALCAPCCGARVEGADDTQQEQRIRFRKWSVELLEELRPEVNQAWKRVLSSSPPEIASKLAKVSLEFSDDESPLYFEAHSGVRQSITVGSGGLASIWFFSDLATLYGLKHITQSALMEYWALNRILFLHGDPLLGPFPKLRNELDKADPTFERTAKGIRQSAIFFVLSHEAAHIVMRHSSNRQKGESSEKWRKRLTKQESLADHVASKIVLNDNQLGGAFGLVLFTSMMIFEPRSTKSFERNPHPPNQVRMRALDRFILDAVEKRKVSSLDAEASRRQAERQRSILSSSDKKYSDLISVRDAVIKEGIFPSYNVKYEPTP